MTFYGSLGRHLDAVIIFVDVHVSAEQEHMCSCSAIACVVAEQDGMLSC
jgi:hypothetical protein